MLLLLCKSKDLPPSEISKPCLCKSRRFSGTKSELHKLYSNLLLVFPALKRGTHPTNISQRVWSPLESPFLSAVFEMSLQCTQFWNGVSPVVPFLPPTHGALSSYLNSDGAARAHGSLWEDTSPCGRGERERVCSFGACTACTTIQ